MDKKIDEKIDDAIGILAGKIQQQVLPGDAMEFSQAALNLAHVKATLQANRLAENERTEASGVKSKRTSAS